MRPVLAASGYLMAMLWCVWDLRARALFQYCCRVILFCAGGHVFGVSHSNVSRVGIGSLSRAVRDVCMASQKVCGMVGYGAFLSNESTGVMASCIAIAAWSLVRRRYLLVHSMWRWGLFPLMYGRCLWQNGHLSS